MPPASTRSGRYGNAILREERQIGEADHQALNQAAGGHQATAPAAFALGNDGHGDGLWPLCTGRLMSASLFSSLPPVIAASREKRQQHQHLLPVLLRPPGSRVCALFTGWTVWSSVQKVGVLLTTATTSLIWCARSG